VAVRWLRVYDVGRKGIAAMLMRRLFFIYSLIAVVGMNSTSSLAEHPAVISKGFIYESASFPSCHASTIEETTDGALVSAWFGGTDEGNPDVGIWVSRLEQGSWTAPVEAATASGVPTWNPVLFQPAEGELLLFYKAGKSPQSWSGLVKRSRDNGKTWSEAELLPAGILGPIKNKPIQLDDGRIICGSSVESYRAWACWVEITADAGRTWSKHGPIDVKGEPYGIIQPTLFETGPGKLAMLCRSTRRIGKVCRATSDDNGVTWTRAETIDLIHPGSGIDAVRIKDGRVVLIYNHTGRGRTPINVGVSTDAGKTFANVIALETEPGEYSYPAVIQADDGKLHVTYTWKRKRIRYVVLDPDRL
jgi:predicted neuraminidase